MCPKLLSKGEDRMGAERKGIIDDLFSSLVEQNHDTLKKCPKYKKE